MEGGAPGRGEHAGLKAYFLQERTMLERLLVARLGSHDDAEAVLQAVWLRLGTMTSPPIAQPGGYLFRIVNGIAIDRQRAPRFRARRAGRRMAPDRAGAVVLSGAAAPVAADRLRQIDAIMATLPDRTARIFRLSRYEHLQRRTIAETIGISVGAVEKHLRHAFRAIHHLGDDARAAGDRSGSEDGR